MTTYDPSRDPRLARNTVPIQSIEPVEPVGHAPGIDSVTGEYRMEMRAPVGEQRTWPGANIGGVPADWTVIPPPPEDLVERDEEPPNPTRKRVKKTGPMTRSKAVQTEAQAVEKAARRASRNIIKNVTSEVIDLTQDDDSPKVSVEPSGSAEVMDVDDDESAETVLESIENDNHDSATTKHDAGRPRDDNHDRTENSAEAQPDDSAIDPSGSTPEPGSRSTSDSLGPSMTWEEHEEIVRAWEEELSKLPLDRAMSPAHATTKRKKTKGEKREKARKKRAARKAKAQASTEPDEASDENEAGTSTPDRLALIEAANRTVPADFSQAATPAYDDDSLAVDAGSSAPDVSPSDAGRPSTPPRAARHTHAVTPSTKSPKAPLFTIAEDQLIIDASLRGETNHSISTLPGLQNRSAQSVDKRVSKLIGLERDELSLPANWKGYADGEDRAWRPEEDSELLRWKRDGCVELRTDIFEPGRSREAMRERVEHLMVTRGMGAGGVENERWASVEEERGRKGGKKGKGKA